MVTALPYLLLVVFYGLLAVYQYTKDDEQTRFYINVFSVGAFLLFFGLRGFIFYDWVNYYPTFLATPDLKTQLTIPLLKWEAEYGFTLLMIFCRSIYPNWHFFVFVCTLINVILLLNFLKSRVENIPFVLVLFLCFGGLELSTDLMRNSIAILVFINSITFIQQRKPLPFVFLCLLGALFHLSALFYLPFYLILRIRYNKWLLIAIFIVVNAIYLLHIPIFKTLISLVASLIVPSAQLWIEEYMEFDVGGSVLSIGYLERLISGILLFCYINKLRECREEGNIFVNSMAMYLFLYLLLSEFRTISVRVSMLFVFGYWIFWYDMLKCFYYRSNRLLFASFIGIYSLLKVYGICSNPLASYDNLLSGIKSYTERVVLFRRHFDDVKNK
ncbi:MAG: EpsG family protein [Prevotella sp.]|nr:EpsG family protein [Prevotella sp.]